VKLTINIHAGLRLRMSGVVGLLTVTASRLAQINSPYKFYSLKSATIL
jgi:hypothetical protein